MIILDIMNQMELNLWAFKTRIFEDLRKTQRNQSNMTILKILNNFNSSTRVVKDKIKWRVLLRRHTKCKLHPENQGSKLICIQLNKDCWSWTLFINYLRRIWTARKLDKSYLIHLLQKSLFQWVQSLKEALDLI